jgi:zinc transport system substrate-binding protein
MNLTRRSALKAGGTGLLAGLAGCLSEPGDGSSESTTGSGSGYTALFMLQDWATSISGEAMTFEPVLSVGEAGHGWEPPSDLILDVAESDMFLYIDSPEFTWAQDIADQVEQEGVTTIDAMSALDDSQLLDFTHEHGHDEGHDEDGHDGAEGSEFYDPHVWLDPVLAEEMVGYIADRLGDLNGESEQQYQQRADEYTDRIADIDQQFQELTDQADSEVAVFAGHDSFQYIEQRYGFEIHSPQGVSPNAEPSPDEIAETIELVEDNDIDTILYDPFETQDGSPPPLARRLLEETEAEETAPLTSLDGTTQEWADNDWGWVEQMTEINLPALRAALGTA